MGGIRLRRRAARPRARRPGTHACAAPLLLEEREVDSRAAPLGDRRAWLLGGQRLPQLRRSVAGARGPGRLPSAPDGTRVELTVERLADGEVSPYLTDELRPGDRIELRGPVGGYFVWEPSDGGPLMAMIRVRAAAASDADTRLLFSSRTWDDVIYREELERLKGDGLTVLHTLTRSQPSDWPGYARRVDAEMLAEVGPDPAERPHVYVCGSTPFVEVVASALVQLGHDAATVKTERFGPTGG